MKQNITIDQLNELSEKGKEKLREWWKPVEGNTVYTQSWFEDVPVFAKDADFSNQKVFNMQGIQIGLAAPAPEIEKWKKVKREGYSWIYETEDSEGYPTVLDKGDFPLLSIGLMIEFLDNGWADEYLQLNGKYIEDGMYFALKNEELCDALWQAVKEVLEK